MYAYSLRDRTHAAYKLHDDVPAAVKQQRLAEVIAAFRKGALARNQRYEVGT
jgi:tRNA A37 methylthiotransferase MiaB